MIWAYLIHLGVHFWKKPGGDDTSAQLFKELPTEDKAWREVVDYLATQGINTLLIDLGEGVQYESHPELATKGAWSKEKLKKELDRIRALGMTPIPKLNFATIHNCWMGEYGSMSSTPIYYKVVKDLIDEAIELFDNPPYLHLGLDEEVYDPFLSFNVLQMQKKYGISICRANKLFWEDVNYMAKCCLDKGVRPWMWGCCAWVLPEESVKNIPKDMLVSNWYYNRWANPPIMTDYNRAAMEAYYVYARNGFDQVPTGSTITNSMNLDETFAHLKDQPNIKGFMTAPWFRTREIDVLKHKAEAKIFNAAIKKHYPNEK